MHGENSRQNAQLAELTSELNRIHASKSYKFFVALSNPACALKRIPIIIKLLALISAYKNKRIVLKSGYFDEIWYLGHYPDVGNSGIDPLRHFIQFGGSEKRNPGPAFDTLYYLQSNSDVRLSGMNPLLHFLRYGNKEGRLPKAGMVTMTPPLPDSSKARSYTSGIGTKLLERIKASGDLQLISQSGLFDSAYYLRNNEDVRASGINPLRHYYFHGWLEGRSPGNNFDDQYYLSANPDVRKSEINPLLHYVKYGKKEGRLPKAFEINEADCKNEADITELLTATAIDNHLKISVVCHLYYPEMLDEILAYLAHFQVQFDLIITTTHEKHGLIQQKILDKNPGYRVNIVDFENRGRDIGPFVSVLSSHLMEYDVICKIHTKSSIHDINLKGWRKYLYDQLLGNSQIIETILNHFQNDSELGMVWPLPFPYLASMGLDKGWGPPNGREQNFSRAIKTFPEMEFINIDENISFPIGSMFWFRPQSLRFIASKLLKVEDFEPETQQIDGTLAHAIERTLGIMVKKTGYTTKTVFFSNELINRNIFKNRDILYTESVLFVAHDLYLAGAEMILLNILNWFFRHTALKLFVLAIKKGNDGGKMLPEYQKVCSVIHLGEIAAANNPDETFKKIREITGEINLIYGNTIISAGIYDMLKGFNAPYITHIHELEKSINKYVSVEVLGILKKYTQTYIACSQPVVDNLVNNHGISADHVEKVYEFIHTGRDPLPDRNLQRMGWDMPINKTIIWSCGTIYWRKGPDLFIKTAKLLKDAGFKDFVFYWIGENFWNAENAEWGKWSTWEDYIIQNNLSDAVVFMGGKADPREYFKAGDIFYLPSREDPFPVVCLEAAECGLPIICFDGAGGIQEFVGTNAGMIVPYEDISAAGQAIGELIKDQNRCKSIGLKAREKILSQYTDDIAVPEILKISRNAMKSNPLISIIVPVYNQARFLHQRIESILNQTFRDVEILILDDCSSDESLLIASQYKKHPSVSILQNSTNSGSPFRQWKKGIEIAKGDFIWIAEGDDWSEPGFLESLLPYFNDSEVVIAYCNSNRIDESENVSENFYTKSAHYNGLVHEPMRWAENYIAEGLSEINNALCIRNTIPNASAVLWRSKHLKCVDFEDCTNFKSCGDWFAYVSVLKQGKIAYHAQSLNYHRIHAASVVAQTKASASETLPDYYKMHQYIVKNHNIPYASFQLMLNSITNGLRHSYPGITDYEFERLYCTSKLQELYG
jgi:glycosyltransferase involved in cell wall biosynthesis